MFLIVMPLILLILDQELQHTVQEVVFHRFLLPLGIFHQQTQNQWFLVKLWLLIIHIIMEELIDFI